MKQYRVGVMLCVLAAGAGGQYRDLSTDRGGTRVLFSSSHSLAGDAEQKWQKLFEASQGGVRLYRVEDPGYDITQVNPREQSYFRLVAPEVSSDGRLVAFTGQRYCLGGSGCAFWEGQAGRVAGLAGGELMGPGRVRISANGRWALFHNWVQPMIADGFHDLVSGQVWRNQQRSMPMAGVGRRVMAGDGTTVFGSLEAGLRVLRPGRGVEVIAGPPAVTVAVVDDQARFAVYQAGGLGTQWLGLVDLYTKEDFLAVFAEEGATDPSLSEDGTMLLFLSAANWEARNDAGLVQAWVMDLITGRLRQVTEDEDGIEEATISGDGQVVFAASGGGRLLRVDLLGGEPQVLGGATAAPLEGALYGDAGLPLRINGRGLERAEVRLGGQALTVTLSGPRWIEVLIPAGTAAGATELEFRSEESPFRPWKVPLSVGPPIQAMTAGREARESSRRSGGASLSDSGLMP